MFCQSMRKISSLIFSVNSFRLQTALGAFSYSSLTCVKCHRHVYPTCVKVISICNNQFLDKVHQQAFIHTTMASGSKKPAAALKTKGIEKSVWLVMNESFPNSQYFFNKVV